MGGPVSTVRSQAIAGTLQAFREAVALHDQGRMLQTSSELVKLAIEMHGS
jgi:hypothetical protein